MRFDQSKGFLGHILQFKGIKLAAIVGKDEQERKLRLEELESALAAYLQGFEKTRLQVFEPKEIASLEEEILSPSFFHPSKFIIVRTSEKVIALAQGLLSRLPDGVFLVLLMESLSDKLYQVLKSTLVVLDLKEEKPWQQKERLVGLVYQQFKHEKKKIASPLVQEIVNLVGLDEGALLRFIENLVCYTAGKETIELSDLKACLKTRAKLNGWQLVDSILFGEKIDQERCLEDASDALGLIAQIRYKLQQIAKWKMGADEGYYSQKTRYLGIYGVFAPTFFTEFSAFLFELELSFKNGFHDPYFLVDLIQAKLKYLKIRYSNPKPR